MMCYKDKTFCFSDCANKDCYRYLSKDESKRADRLGLYCAFSDFSKTCPDYVGGRTDEN